MAGDWIKMRPSLVSSPKVNGIARYLEDSKEVTEVLSTGFRGAMSEIVTRNVMRNVVITSLLVLWGAANEHTDDGVFKNADLSDIDDIVGIPKFGDAMESVGWAKYDENELTVTLPNFNEYNTCGKDRSAEKAAERQKRYREKKKVESDASNNVTNDVTRDDREEKRREELTTESKAIVVASDSTTSQPAEKAQRKTSGTPKRTRISADFYPNETGLALAVELGVSVSKELPQFCDYHASKGALNADWQATWRTWVRNSAKWAKPNVASFQSKRDADRQNVIDVLTKPSFKALQERDITGECHAA